MSTEEIRKEFTRLLADHVQHMAKAYRDPDIKKFSFDPFIDEAIDLIRKSNTEAVRRYEIEKSIERLDVQCLEGNCVSCDRKRPLLKKLQAELSNTIEETQ